MTDLRAAVAAGALGSEESYRELLQAIVECARAIFGAKASSIFLHDEETDVHDEKSDGTEDHAGGVKSAEESLSDSDDLAKSDKGNVR